MDSAQYYEQDWPKSLRDLRKIETKECCAWTKKTKHERNFLTWLLELDNFPGVSTALRMIVRTTTFWILNRYANNSDIILAPNPGTKQFQDITITVLDILMAIFILSSTTWQKKTKRNENYNSSHYRNRQLIVLTRASIQLRKVNSTRNPISKLSMLAPEGHDLMAQAVKDL